jgi:L-asparaginase / beta-aspartyl-peptidase
MYALAIHGGAGALPPRTLSTEREAAFHDGLARALGAAQAILEADGRALDAVEEAAAAHSMQSR